LSYKNNRPIVVGFLFENEGTNKELSTFAVPIDQIEALTGLDFFSKLPDNIEVDIESKVDLSNWPF
jgi:endonuclease G